MKFDIRAIFTQILYEKTGWGVPRRKKIMDKKTIFTKRNPLLAKYAEP